MQRRTLLKTAISLASACAAGGVSAQADKPISIVLGYAAGGTTDVIARTIAADMAKSLGRSVVVENVPGASGMLAAQKVANAASDGAMIYLGGTDTVLIPTLNKAIKVNWERDFHVVGSSTYVSMVFAVPAKSPHQTLSDLLKTLRKDKKDFTYATPGVGTMQHLYGSLIGEKGKVSMVHVPYKGGAPIVNELVGGHIDSAILTTTSALQFIKDGSIRALSIADATRSPLMPNVKTIGEEEGFSALSLPLWHAFFVKAGTPASVVAAYEKALLSAMANPEVQKKFRDAGATPWPMAGKDLAPYIKRQEGTYKAAIAAANIVME